MKLFTEAALIADALSLGPHWIYNQNKLARLYPDGVYSVTDPVSDYHPNRSAGDFTHYGDQTLWLSTLVEKEGRFDLDQWRETWLSSMSEYDGYQDGASQETIAHQGSSPSGSNDLAGASRIAPLLDLDLSLDETIAAARAQTNLTHGDPEVIDAAEFFVRSVFAIRNGKAIEAAFQQAAKEGTYQSLQADDAITIARESNPDSPLEVASKIGLTCHFPEAFPLTLYFALRPGADYSSALSDNNLAGGDTSARAMLLALLFAARDGRVKADFSLPLEEVSAEATKPGSNPVSIQGSSGVLSGVLEMPTQEPRAFALFAHCFTCGKDFLPQARIAQGLAERGIATLRIDFSGLGASAGEFSDSSFLTNLDDLITASNWLRENHSAPLLLVGHSLGGAAVLAAAGQIDEIRAVVTIGAPFDPDHVTHLFTDHLAEIEKTGEANVQLAGRSFTIGKKFLDDLKEHNHENVLSNLRGVDTLILHSPIDEVVSIENAGKIYATLKHPKSFVSLAGADHLLTKQSDVSFVADLISVWAGRAISNFD